MSQTIEKSRVCPRVKISIGMVGWKRGGTPYRGQLIPPTQLPEDSKNKKGYQKFF